MNRRLSLLLPLLALPLADMVALPEASPAKVMATTAEEFAVERPYGKLMVRVEAAEGRALADDPLLLLNFSTDRQASMVNGKYGSIVRPFLEQGHRVASFDLPNHGERVDAYGAGMPGIVASVAAGQKPFDVFVEDGQRVIDELIRRGLAKPGRIVVCGVSRGGYCAYRLAADDKRISAVAGLAPVTDWNVVWLFEELKDRPEVKALALTHHADKLAGRRVYAAIGNADTKARTDACTQFMLAITEAEKRQGLKTSGVRYLVVDDSTDHSLATKWRREGIQFLMTSPKATPANDQ